MATLKDFESSEGAKRVHRYFSEGFRRKKVEELDKKVTTIGEICKEYQVSHNAVYKWIYKYSLMKKKGVKMVIEPESDTRKIKLLKDQISKLEQLLGQKQFQIDFMEKQMEIVSEQYGVDFKKKASGRHSAGFGDSENNTTTK